MKRKIVPITFVSLTLGLLFDFLFYGKIPGISVFIYSALIIVFTFYLATRFGSKLNKSVYFLVPMILFFSFMVFLRASELLAFINIILILYLLLLFVRLARQPDIPLRHYSVMQYFRGMGSLPFSFISEFLQALQRALNNRNSSAQRSSYAPVIRGIAISLPFLAIFLLLLSSADLVFKKYIGSILDFNLAPETIFRWGLLVFIASMFVGAYAFIFIRSKDQITDSDNNTKSFSLGSTESSIILGSVGSLFLIFVLIQITYLFGGSNNVTYTGYTYAEYARKGFFELIAVAVISMLLIWAVIKSARNISKHQIVRLKWLSGILILEVTVIMISAHLRLSLYEQAYGFTVLRLFSHLFIGWLAIVFVLLLLYIIRDEQENLFAFRTFMSVVAFFIIFNLINPDGLIARQNINRYNTAGKLDLYYLGTLSEDATPALVQLLNHPNEDLRKTTANILYYKQLALESKSVQWQSANIARSHASQLLDNKSSDLEASKDYNNNSPEFR